MIFINSYTSFPAVVQTSVEYPPLPGMTTNSTPITTASYGNGTYIASASSILNGGFAAFYAFDKSNLSQNGWITPQFVYATSTGLYAASVRVSTSVVTVGNVDGEFLQLQIPTLIQITSYSITSSIQGAPVPNRTPRNWLLVASTNGTTWLQIDARTNVTFSSSDQTLSFAVTGASSYNYFRLIVQGVQPSNDGYCHIRQMRLFGIPAASPYITANLQAYYDFSNASSYPGSGLTVTDLSGMNRNLTFTANPTFVSSPPYVVLTNSTYAQRLNVNLNFTTGITYEIVYRTTSINFQYIVLYDDGTNGFVVQVHPSLNSAYMNSYGTGISGIGNSLNTSNNSIVANTWYHVVFTITSGGVWASYLNSVNRAGGSLSTFNPSVTNRTLSIGGDNSSTTNVGLFRVYNRALTSGEITQNYNTVKSTYSLP